MSTHVMSTHVMSTHVMSTHVILQQIPNYTSEMVQHQLKAKAEIHKLKRQQATSAATSLKQALPTPLTRAMELAGGKGASSWLTSLPIEEFGFSLHKSAFCDALALRYGWQLPRTPSHCACGTIFTVEHALSCPKGAFPTIRHNEIRDLTANLLTEVCHDVLVEPDLQPITREALSGAMSNTQDGARLDIAANGVWGGRFERTMYGYSIHMLPPTDTHRCQHATGNTRGLRNAPMSSASEKLSMPPSLHWYSLPLAG